VLAPYNRLLALPDFLKSPFPFSSGHLRVRFCRGSFGTSHADVTLGAPCEDNSTLGLSYGVPTAGYLMYSRHVVLPAPLLDAVVVGV
jgi:hypothetical protein